MKSKLLVAVTCMLVVVSLAAWGLSASSAAPTATAAAKAKAPTGAPIVLGTICSCSGAQAGTLGKEGAVATAWAKSVNASGGINHHPVKLIVKDDGSDPAKGLADAKALVAAKVVAIVGETSLVDGNWASYIAQQGIPVVGGISVESPFVSNPDFFASGTNIIALTLGTFNLAKGAHKKSAGVLYCAESPVCAQLDPIAKTATGELGLNYTSDKVSATAPNYTAPCLELKSKGVDALFVADNPAVVLRVVDGCAQQGYKPQTVSQTTTAATNWLKDKNMNGALLSAPNADPSFTSLPAVRAFLAAVNKFAPGVTRSSQFGYDSMFPWVGGQLFEAAAQKAKLGPNSKPADVKRGLYALKNDTLGGLAPPLTYVPNKVTIPHCYFVVGVKSGKFTSPQGTKSVCIGNQINSLYTALGLKSLL